MTSTVPLELLRIQRRSFWLVVEHYGPFRRHEVGTRNCEWVADVVVAESGFESLRHSGCPMAGTNSAECSAGNLVLNVELAVESSRSTDFVVA